MVRDSPQGMKFEERDLSSRNPVVFHEYTFDEDTSIRMHYHSSLEINICSGSEGFIHVEGSSLALADYSLIVLQPNTLHSYQIKGNGSKIQVWHIGIQHLSYINSLSLERHLKESYPYSLCFQSGNPQLEKLLKDSLKSDNLNRSAKVLSVLNLVFQPSSEKQKIESRDAFLHRIQDYSEKNYPSKITIDDAASEAHLSRYHFCRKFKEKTGSSYGVYLNNLRLENSLLYLNEGCSVSEAAGKSGMDDPSYFIKRFKIKFGITPGEYAANLDGRGKAH